MGEDPPGDQGGKDESMNADENQNKDVLIDPDEPNDADAPEGPDVPDMIYSPRIMRMLTLRMLRVILRMARRVSRTFVWNLHPVNPLRNVVVTDLNHLEERNGNSMKLKLRRANRREMTLNLWAIWKVETAFLFLT